MMIQVFSSITLTGFKTLSAFTFDLNLTRKKTESCLMLNKLVNGMILKITGQKILI